MRELSSGRAGSLTRAGSLGTLVVLVLLPGCGPSDGSPTTARATDAPATATPQPRVPEAVRIGLHRALAQKFVMQDGVWTFDRLSLNRGIAFWERVRAAEFDLNVDVWRTEIRDASIDCEAAEVSKADALNGIEAQGTVLLRPGPYREGRTAILQGKIAKGLYAAAMGHRRDTSDAQPAAPAAGSSSREIASLSLFGWKDGFVVTNRMVVDPIEWLEWRDGAQNLVGYPLRSFRYRLKQGRVEWGSMYGPADWGPQTDWVSDLSLLLPDFAKP